MATIKELKDLEKAIRRQFPDGLQSTADELQLDLLIEYNRTLANLNLSRKEQKELLENRHSKTVSQIEAILKKNQGDFSPSKVAAEIALLLLLLTRINSRVSREIVTTSKDLGRLHRMRNLKVFDDFNLNQDGPSTFNSPNGAFKGNLADSKKRMAATKSLMNSELKIISKVTLQELKDLRKTGEPALDVLVTITAGLETIRNQADRALVTEGVSSVNAGIEDTNEDSDIEKYSWSAVFDSKTCAICLNLNGRIFDYANKTSPHPPAHQRCRCLELPVIEDELVSNKTESKGLNREGIPETGSDFLKGKNRAFLQNTLGSKLKAELFLDGVPLNKIVTRTGRIKRDKELLLEFRDKSQKAIHKIDKRR